MAQSVGEQLKQTRLARGLTLDQAAQTTRIRRHYLEALERDDHDSLPSPVQGRGFLRLYAGYLNLPAEVMVALWEGRPLPEPVPAPTPPEPAETTAAPAEAEGQPASAGSPPEDRPGIEEPSAPVEKPAEMPAEPPLEVTIASIAESQPSGQNGSREIFKQLGVDLRKQRDALSLSIPDVERYTRLRQHYLRAMESGHLEELPSLVQGRGMLSNYATFLNLDADEILLRYADGLQQRRLERMTPAGAETPSGQRQLKGARQVTGMRRLLTPDMLIGVSLILILFIFVLWTAARINAIRGGEVQSTLPSVGEVLSLTTTATLDQTGEAVIALTNLPSGGSGAVTLPPPANLPTQAPSATLAPINSDPLQVYIIARQRAFLRVVIDGQIKFNARVVPGNAYPFSGTESIELISGNAEALQVFFNQTDMGTLGAAGDVLRITFTKSGAVTPTPLPTPTAAPTVGITVTPGPSPTVATPSVTPLIP